MGALRGAQRRVLRDPHGSGSDPIPQAEAVAARSWARGSRGALIRSPATGRCGTLFTGTCGALEPGAAVPREERGGVRVPAHGPPRLRSY